MIQTSVPSHATRRTTLRQNEWAGITQGHIDHHECQKLGRMPSIAFHANRSLAFAVLPACSLLHAHQPKQDKKTALEVRR
jgi:hypothetical protein